MTSELKENIITQIELEAEDCPTIYAMFSADKEGTINLVYNKAIETNENSIQGAIYDLEQAYAD